MEKLKDIEHIYKKVLIQKLKHPELWTEHIDFYKVIKTQYIRTYCFSKTDNVYFRIYKPGKVKIIEVYEDRLLNHFGEIIPELVYIFKITFFDFKIKFLMKKLRYYFEYKNEIIEKDFDIEKLKKHIPKETIRTLKLNKIINRIK